MCLQAELVSYSQKFAMTPSACCGRAFIYEGDVPLCAASLHAFWSITYLRTLSITRRATRGRIGSSLVGL